MLQVTRIATEIEKELEKVGIKAEIKGRPKHFYSIYKKMVNQQKTLDQIYDLIAVRVIVDDVKECYTVLGTIHSMWKPVPGRFKDYIAMPKPNLYQSLHTTVVSNFGQIFEIQIRTQEMNRIAEYGIAAHWKYKEGRVDGSETEIDKRLSWVREVMEAEEDIKDSQEYLKTLKLNIVSNEIYVFSPKGEVFDLPVGATAVDFAYKVHTAVGNKCIGARVNNKMVPLNTALNTGDVVEIITSNASKGPSRDWLKFVVTSQACGEYQNGQGYARARSETQGIPARRSNEQSIGGGGAFQALLAHFRRRHVRFGRMRSVGHQSDIVEAHRPPQQATGDDQKSRRRERNGA